MTALASPDTPALQSCRLTGSGLARQSRLKPRYRPDGYEDGFDHDTLWYDAIQTGGRVHVVCPRLYTLWPALRGADWRLDGEPARLVRRRRHARHEILEFDAPLSVRRLTVTLGGWTGGSGISRDGSHLFAGLNAAICMSRNNDLRWIADFARYHIHHHGLQAMIVMDNGSDRYGVQEVRDALATTGLRRVVVLPAPFRYGPRGRRPYARAEKFLQTAMFNVLRLRYLPRARAVLNCDIDELMHTPGTTVFDLAVHSRLGYARLPGAWRYSDPGAEAPSLHANHVYAHPRSSDCPPKWCIVPAGPLAGYSWDTHRLEGFPLNRLFLSDRGRFWHCYAVSTAWKESRRHPPWDDLERDPEMAAALEAVFGPPR